MDSLEVFEKIKKYFTLFFDRDEQKLSFTTHRDWTALIGVFFALIIILAGVGAFLFSHVNRGDIFTVESESISPDLVLDKRKLVRVIDEYEIRAKSFEALISKSPSLPPDPSQ